MKFKKDEYVVVSFTNEPHDEIIRIDYEGVSEEDVKQTFAILRKDPFVSVSLLQKTIHEFDYYGLDFLNQEELYTNPSYWFSEKKKKANERIGINKWHEIPESFYIEEFQPEDIYRVFFNKKTNQLDILLKNGTSESFNIE